MDRPKENWWNLTKDPLTANCRVFVGGLGEVIKKAEFQEFFSQFGPVLAVAINK